MVRLPIRFLKINEDVAIWSAPVELFVKFLTRFVNDLLFLTLFISDIQTDGLGTYQMLQHGNKEGMKLKQFLRLPLLQQKMQIAALSAYSSQTASLLKVVVDKFRSNVSAYASLTKRLSAMIAASEKPEVIRQLIQKSVTPATNQQLHGKVRYCKGLRRD